MNSSGAKVLIIDDDVELCRLIGEFLRHDGFDVHWVNAGTKGLDLLKSNDNFDIVILDIMMPDISGMEVLQTLRKASDIPVIMLTGRGDDIDRIVGLEMGADDYLGKPCNTHELAARIRSVLRRYEGGSITARKTASNTTLSIHGVMLNCGERCVTVQGKELNLTSVEFDVLRLLMEEAGTIVTRASLTEIALHRKLSAYDRSIDVHVSRIRQKLNVLAELGQLIQSVRGAGYQFICDGSSNA